MGADADEKQVAEYQLIGIFCSSATVEGTHKIQLLFIEAPEEHDYCYTIDSFNIFLFTCMCTIINNIMYFRVICYNWQVFSTINCKNQTPK